MLPLSNMQFVFPSDLDLMIFLLDFLLATLSLLNLVARADQQSFTGALQSVIFP